VSKLLLPERPLIVLPTLAKLVGLNESIFLQQLHYWLIDSKHQYDERKWIFNTFEDWEKQFPFWSVRTIKRIVTSLRDQNLIITTSEYNKFPVDQTLWYTINYEALELVALPLGQVGTLHSDNVSQSDSDKLAPPITIEYTETTKPESTNNSLPFVPSTASKDTKGASHPNTKLILKAYEYELGYTPPNYGREAKAAKQLAELGFAVADTVVAYRMLKEQKFYRDKFVSLTVVLQQIRELSRYAKSQQGSEEGIAEVLRMLKGQDDVRSDNSQRDSPSIQSRSSGEADTHNL
jgi:hypothetical protein